MRTKLALVALLALLMLNGQTRLTTQQMTGVVSEVKPLYGAVTVRQEGTSTVQVGVEQLLFWAVMRKPLTPGECNYSTPPSDVLMMGTDGERLYACVPDPTRPGKYRLGRTVPLEFTW